MVVMVVVNPFLLQVAVRSAYLTCFRWLASSSPVSNGTVSSTRWALELSHIAMSGLSSVRATDGGKEYWAPGRSAVIDMPSGIKVVSEKSVDAGIHIIMPFVVSPHIQSHRTVIEDVKLALDLILTTQRACWRWYLLPQAQVLVVGQGVSGGVEGKFEYSFRE